MEFLLYLATVIYLCIQAVFLKIYFSDQVNCNLKSPTGYELEQMNVTEDYDVDLSKIKELNFLKFKK